MATIGRRAYAEMFGPTVGDRVRLADTELILEVEADHTLRAGSYGEEVKFGGGKTIRDGMAQSQRSNAQGAVDTVLTNALGFDRAAARGMRLNIASGTAVRFEPGQERTVELVDYAGERRVFGFQGLTQGPL